MKVRAATTVVKPQALTGPAPKQNEPARPNGDTFKTGAAKALAPLRPAQTAVTFIKKFESGLGLSSEAREQRVKFMKHSVLDFFRANPSLFAQDNKLAYDAKLLGRPAPKVTIGGDAHLGNFGVVRGPKGDPVWSMNDFDQATTGSPEQDLQRLAASAVLVARSKGWGVADQQWLVRKAAHAYADAIDGGDAYAGKGDTFGVVKDLIRTAEGRTRATFLEQWTDGKKFIKNPELEGLSAQKREAVTDAVREYSKSLPTDAPIARPVEVLDVARRVNAGGSTLGLDRFYVLVAGKDDKRPRLLELKEFPPPGSSELSKADPHEVVLSAQKLAGFRNPLFGSAELGGQKLLVREVEPERQRLDVGAVAGDELEELVEQAAAVLARSHGHAAELKRWIGGDEGALADQLASFGVRYANQVQADYSAFAAAN